MAGCSMQRAGEREGVVVLAGILSVFLLAGCASQAAYQSAQSLSASGNVEAGLAKFQEAMKLDPDSVEFKAAYVRTREQATRNFLKQADQLLETGQREESAKIYRRVLAIDPNNERAHAGIELLARDERHAELLNEADAELEKKNIDAAKTKLSVVLTEDPKNEKARTMLRTIEEKTEAPAPALESLLAAAYKQPISIEFKDASLKQVFEVIARTSGLNILFDKDVKVDQKTSIFLKDSTIEAAIYYLLLTNQLEQQVMDANTLLIYPDSADKQKNYQQMVVKTFLLANAKASAVADTLKTIIKVHDVVVDDKLNMLIVRDSPEAMRLAEKLIATQDVPEPEVMLEVEVLEVSREKLLQLGVNLPGSLTLTPLSTTGGATLTLADLRNLNQNSVGATLNPVTINAQKVDTDADILANPRIRVLNHEKAKIVIGERVPSITSSAVPSANGTIISQAINYLDVGLKLEVEPTIYLDDDVAIRIGLDVSSIISTQTTADGTVAYTIGTRTANTMLRLKDGENQVLAGLINDQDQRTANKFPGLGDIPILGRLFGSTLHDGTKTEIVLSITPHLIRNIKRPDAAASEFLSGTENSLRRRPDFSLRTRAAPVAEVTAPPEPGAAKPADVAPDLKPSPTAPPADGEAGVEKATQPQTDE
ncbi:MAG: secretin N-terminal domain-containing protein [Gallionellaceae bacterium]